MSTNLLFMVAVSIVLKYPILIMVQRDTPHKLLDIVHSETCESWEYAKLHKAIEKQAIDEMRHAEWLIQRILFLEGTPNVSAVNAMHIGKTVHAYNAAIRSARDVDDQVTADLLITILKMEEEHLDWGEIQQSQIEQIGLENHLTNQTEGTG